MSRKFSDLDVATSLGENNEFLVDQNGVPYRIAWNTIKSSAENAGSVAGAAAGSVAGAGAGSVAGAAAAQVVFASLEERVSANTLAITSVQAMVSKSDVNIATNVTDIATNLAAITSVQAQVSKSDVNIATNVAAITSVQAMVSKSDVKQTSVASQSDGIATAMLEAIVASTANTSTYGYRVSAENGIRTDKSGTPGNGQILFALDFGTLTCVGNVGQDAHMPHWDSLGKEQLCPVSSLAHKFTSIASGVTRDDAGQIITGGALVSVYFIGDVSTGTQTLDYGLRPMQAYKNKGAHTLAPDTQTGYITLIIKASTGAGAITTSGWSLVDGDAFETSSGGHFICYVQTTEAQSGTNKSHLNVKII